MAGIGFELRKIYNEDSLFSKQKAYAYAGIVYTGPMLLGILLTAGVVVLTMVAGISENERDYILSNLTYAIIFSLVITSLFSLVVTLALLWTCSLREKFEDYYSFILLECFDACS